MVRTFDKFRWTPGVTEVGYHEEVRETYSLRERIDIAKQMSRKELENHLAWHSDSYTSETLSDIIQCVAAMSKPMAEILDDLKIPRDKIYYKWIPVHGPAPEFVGPQNEGPSHYLRRVVPGLIKATQESLQVQPIFKPESMRDVMAFFGSMRYPTARVRTPEEDALWADLEGPVRFDSPYLKSLNIQSNV